MDPNNPIQPQSPQVVQPTNPVPPAPVPPVPQPIAPPVPAPQPLPTTPLVPTASVVTPKKKGGMFGKFMIFLLLLLILGGGAAGAYYYFMVMNKPAAVETSTPLVEEEVQEELSEELIAIPDTEIVSAPETVNYTDDVYRFSIEYLSSWDFSCQNCGEIPEASSSAWTVLEMKTFDFAVDEEDKILRGSRLTIKASENAIMGGTDYNDSTYNGIEGKLNLDPSTPTQGFIYEDTDTGLFMHLEWKSTTASDRSDQELQTILKSFKKI